MLANLPPPVDIRRPIAQTVKHCHEGMPPRTFFAMLRNDAKPLYVKHLACCGIKEFWNISHPYWVGHTPELLAHMSRNIHGFGCAVFSDVSPASGWLLQYNGDPNAGNKVAKLIADYNFGSITQATFLNPNSSKEVKLYTWTVPLPTRTRIELWNDTHIYPFASDEFSHNQSTENTVNVEE